MNAIMNSFQIRISLLVCACCLMMAGCGDSSVAKSTVEAKQKSIDEAVVFFDASKFAECKVKCVEALDGAGLSADQTEQSLSMLIESCLQIGDLELGNSKLTQLASVATDTARVRVLQGLLARKQGDEGRAMQLFVDAQTIDPDIRIPL